ncbi:GntR family transcriptional regulator, mannosyl-D-glycerate transport/metabolism system repressor [Alkalithermobacter thermoalcaliphilus JW-YL-7 = DSM 7308]|uniref:GntR family transcriptional regulator, mannosyl-D-glycerate transport/metabolism system repressor n=1 Tax=Alkalithermobacter thermoalcaliphilus JW-YL-7 = DSM 7308 TaxID=1121328 RepID=A0A150FNS4_CLOPD|nr:transcriptional regulator, GntR family with UTRA sensor domain containing protein [[Clostridium] paradoxum JW-YL-7 = DSM 7308]SHK85124.1 GntR family transcriptional regulator, mannosyl-D-glycerate transport/metabolism system repressor [[Clostridium] paradoxum JW-YL-7 = DSM 7308]
MKNSSPLYKQIANKIKQEIIKENLSSGEAIPSEIKLSQMYNVSRVTIRQAIDTLVSEGLLYKIQGSGTYVKESKIEHNIYNLQGFTEEMRKFNKTPVNKILEFKMIKPDENIRKILKLKENEKTFFVSRLRFIDNVPVVLENTYLPVNIFSDLSYEVMLSSKYEYVEKEKKLKIKESFQEIIPITCNDKLKELFNLKEYIPILKVKLFSTLEDNTIFEYTELYFKSDEYKFTLIAKRT